MAGNKQVVITGMGILACNGMGREQFWDALEHGRSGIRPIDRFDASELPCQIAGQLWEFDPADYLRKSDIKNWNSHVHQSVAASMQALADADFDSAGHDPDRIAVGMGTSIGKPDEAYEGQQEALETGGFKKISRFASSAHSGHSATVHVNVGVKASGPAITIASGCATGLDVIAWGTQQILSDKADAAIVGATESPLFPLAFASACSLGILSKRNDAPEEAMRPYDKGSDGIVLSEGAAVFVLERADMAKARGARILAEVVGNGAASDGMSPLILDKEGRGLARAITASLNDAHMQPHDINMIHSHGVSLAMYDRSETAAIKRALGDQAYRIPISATKSMTGQSYSAGGVMGVGAALLALNKGIVAPTINLETPDPGCDLDYVPQTARFNDVETAMVTAISFGGTHSATVLRRFN